MSNDDLIKVIEDAESSFLREIIGQYIVALNEFSSNRDMLLSNMSSWATPEASTKTSLKYFSMKAALHQACSMVGCPVAKYFYQCTISAEKCPSLVNSNRVDEAAARMFRLGEAKKALFEKYT